MDRRLYQCRLRDAKRDRLITATTQAVALELLRYANGAGRCWPSLDTLAAGVGCCARSAGRAVASLRLVGLLSWVPRRARWNRRAPNLYRLLTPNQISTPAEDKNFLNNRSPAKLSDGSIPAAVAGALARLGAALGVAPDRVAPWLTS